MEVKYFPIEKEASEIRGMKKQGCQVESLKYCVEREGKILAAYKILESNDSKKNGNIIK